MPHRLHHLQHTIGYTFQQPNLLLQALKHCSAEPKTHKTDDNERLEFVGDRVLNLLIADLLYHTFTNEPEGVLAKRHAALVRQDTLAAIGREWQLGQHIHLGHGEEQTGGRRKSSILANAVEAVLAAIYLDSGNSLVQVRTVVLRFWQPKVNLVEIKDPKSKLQELLQSIGESVPTYTMLSATGLSHEKQFVFEVVSQKMGTATGRGRSKQEAQQNAAKALLAQIDNES